MLNNKTAGSLNLSHRLSHRDTITPAIVHLGLGAFHRGHQARITDEFMAISGQRNWGIISANIFGGEQLISDLQAQNHLYTVTEIHSDKRRTYKLVSSIVDTLYAERDRHSLLKAMRSPNTRIVSLTVTEKGYCTNPATGELQLDNPLIAHDLKHPEHPRSAVGLIVSALAARRTARLKPFTVLSCDNMSGNGKRARSAVLQMATQFDPELARWIAEECSFPCTVVDCVVPAVTAEDLATVKDELGVEDKGAIVCEAFHQWIIEDDFVLGRPDWDDVSGVKFVKDVEPYEEMKLRMLNGSHSFMAYLGYLGNYPTISEVASDPDFYAATSHFMKSVAAKSLDIPEGEDLNAYAEELMQRFCNPRLTHRICQVAMDGSQKIPQRWLNTVRWHLEQGSDFAPLALGLAGWMKYVSAIDRNGEAIDVRDPMSAELKLIADSHPGNRADNIAARVKAFLSVSAIFGDDLPKNERFVSEVVSASCLLAEKGARAAVASLRYCEFHGR
ncbi:mannitol dehydrogenase family protein [Parendozoicomonas sp. Alg238-R29]|uniref:mannitol dehydrogenase family protein n=1 Tax=Parendozoicomonas sp. Alg238-R29 TaxID=2993446 RepID=UPI00248DFC47|nr:mannitol dehydrogenase family protein [Parendozoicomonas sp. Alg238-R29]